MKLDLVQIKIYIIEIFCVFAVKEMITAEEYRINLKTKK